MKKVLSILLTLALIFGTLTCAFTGTASALAGADFETPSKWQLFSTGGSIGTVASQVDNVSNDTTNVYSSGDSAKSMKFLINGLGRIIQFNLTDYIKANRQYNLTFWYKGTESSSYVDAGCDVYAPGIYKQGVATSSSTINSSNATRLPNWKDDSWYKYSVDFSVEDDTALYFAMNVWKASVIWIDDMTLTDTTPYYYEDVSNWRLHSNGSTIGNTADTNVSSWLSITQNTDTSYKYEGDVSLNVKAHGRAASIKLQDLEIGKKYQFSFKYFVPTTTSYTSTQKLFQNSGIYKVGGTVSTNGDISGASETLVTAGVDPTGTNGQSGAAVWTDYSITFDCTDTTDLYFAFGKPWLGGTYNFYIDDIKLTDVTPEPEPVDPTEYLNNVENWKNYDKTAVGVTSGNYQPEASIDARTDGASIRFPYLHGSVAAIKLNDIIETGKQYTLSLWYKATLTGTYTDYALYFPGIYKSGANISTSEYTNGVAVADSITGKTSTTEWYNFTITFTATSDDLYFATLGWKTNAVWFDDITLTEVTTPDEPQINYADGYYAYGTGGVVGNESNYDKPVLDTEVLHTEGENETSVKFAGTNSMSGRVAAVKLDNLTAGKSYKLSFWYKGTFASDQTKYMMNASGIYAKGIEITDQTSTLPAGAIAQGVTGITKTNQDEWYQYVLSFTATDTELYFLARMWVTSVLWIDDLTVTEIDYYDVAANWQTLSGNDVIGNTPANTANAPTDTTDADNYIYFAKGMSGGVATVKLTDLEVGKLYKISFMHKGTFTADVPTKYMISAAGVFKSGATIPSGSTLPTDVAVAANAKNYDFENENTWTEYTLTFTATDANLYFAVRTWVTQAFWIDNFTVTKIGDTAVDTSHTEKAAIQQAGTSSTGKQGVRIYNRIDKNFVNSSVKEFGSIAIREGFLKDVYKYVNGTELGTVDTAAINANLTFDLRDKLENQFGSAAGFGKGVSWNKEDVANAKLWNEDENYYEFTAYLTGIAPKHYADAYFIRSYAILNDGSVVYGDYEEVSIYVMVKSILDTESDTTSAGYLAAQEIIDNADAADDNDSSVVTYNEWLDSQQ